MKDWTQIITNAVKPSGPSWVLFKIAGARTWDLLFIHLKIGDLDHSATATSSTWGPSRWRVKPKMFLIANARFSN